MYCHFIIELWLLLTHRVKMGNLDRLVMTAHQEDLALAVTKVKKASQRFTHSKARRAYKASQANQDYRVKMVDLDMMAFLAKKVRWAIRASVGTLDNQDIRVNVEFQVKGVNLVHLVKTVLVLKEILAIKVKRAQTGYLVRPVPKEPKVNPPSST